jgi:hypothetical protein
MISKNWRNWGYILVMIIPIQYVIFISASMYYYVGGTIIDPNSQGYSFCINFLSDLGRTKSYSGKANTTSSILFTIAYLLFGILLIPFLIAVPHFFNGNQRDIRLSKLGSFFGVLSAITLIGIALTPWDIYTVAHGIFAGIQPLTVVLSLILYSIVMFHNEEYPNRYALTFLALTAIWIISVIIPLSGVNENTVEGLTIVVSVQKITTFSTLICLFIQGYGAWKLEKTLY